MQQPNNLIQQLLSQIGFSSQLYQILHKLIKFPFYSCTANQIKIIQTHLVSLTCQNKNLLQFQQIQQNGLNQKCLKLITQILLKLTKLTRDSLINIGNLFHSHIMNHTSCFVSYSVFYLIAQTNQDFFMDFSLSTSIQKLKKINTMIILQFGFQSGITLLKNTHSNQISGNKLPSFLNCQSNLNMFLEHKFKPIKKKTQQDITKTQGSKIPPLLLPTSKSINSSRYSALSRDQRRKGISDLRKLAAGLGQSFIAVQLGSLLSHKRMKQVRQFSQNQDFRQKCLDRIQTDRLNSSRIDNLENLRQIQNVNQNQGENSKKYYKRVLLLNANLIYKRLIFEAQKSRQKQLINANYKNNNLSQKNVIILSKLNNFPFDVFNQFYDMSILGIIDLNHLFQSKSTQVNINSDEIDNNLRRVNTYTTLSNHNGDIYTSLKPILKSFQKIITVLMQKSSQQSQLTHLTMLMNRNKENTPNYYQMKTQNQEIQYQSENVIQNNPDFIPTQKNISYAKNKSSYGMSKKNNYVDNDGIQRVQRYSNKSSLSNKSNRVNTNPKNCYSLQRINSIKLVPNVSNGCKLSHQQILNSRTQSDYVIFIIQKSLRLLFGANKSFNLSMDFHKVRQNLNNLNEQFDRQQYQGQVINKANLNVKSPKGKFQKQQTKYGQGKSITSSSKKYHHQRSHNKQKKFQQNSFYEYQSNILNVLGFYLQKNYSKSTPYQVIDMLIPFLILIKRQLIELSHPFFNKDFDIIGNTKYYNKKIQVDQPPAKSNSTHKSSKNQSLLKKDKKKKSTNSKVNSPYMQKTFSPCKHLQKNPKQQDIQQIPNQQQVIENKQIPLIYCHYKLFARYLHVISCIFTNNKHVQKLFSNLFFKNIHFMQLVQNYLQFLFTKDNAQDQIILVLKFYKRSLQIYHQRKLRNQDCKTLRILFQHIYNLLCPKTGCISILLQNNQEMISPWNLDSVGTANVRIPNSFQKAQGPMSFDNSAKDRMNIGKNTQMSTYELKQLILTHEVLKFIAEVYYYSEEDYAMNLLQQDIVPFYIKYSTLNFIKLYSFLTVSQLAHLNLQQYHNYSSKQSPSYVPCSSQVFMIDFLKILTNISINRTPEISKKFRQYRVLQFFVRQLQLQFCVAHNIDKYVKTMNRLGKQSQKIKAKQGNKKGKKKQQSKKVDKQQQSLNNQFKKPIIPGLNLTGSVFKSKQMGKSNQDNDSQQNTQKNNYKSEQNQYNTKIYKKQQDQDNQQQQNSSQEQEHQNQHMPILNFGNNDHKKPSFSMNIPSLKLPSSQTNLSNQYNKNISNSNNIMSLKLQLENINKIKEQTNINASKQSQRNLIYAAERKIRKIYSNRTLHSESILLILSLLLYKGLLDPNYCDRFPITHGKINVLYILHFHLNDSSNKSILPLLGQSVAQIKPYLSGQRLLKLLSSQFTNISHYQDWKKISKGAYGTVYSCKTSFHDPQQVAIKQMNFPKTIYERCVLHDIFAQITCLQNFRLDPRVTTMYNYGVIDNTYVIVMKKYRCSLRQWCVQRVKQNQQKRQKNKSNQKYKSHHHPNDIQNGGQNIKIILSIYLKVLNIVKVLHQHNITHYDIKGDNIMLQFQNNNKNIYDCIPSKVVFGDFGQCKIFQNEKDQLDMKSRGTQCVQSPQMLTISLHNKKQADNYDRRRKIGTTKASDIWSLGCLLYQMITGDYLYHRPDWFKFYAQVTSPTAQLLLQQDLIKLNHNTYIIDFLKLILVRDPQHRPSINTIIQKFNSMFSFLFSNPQTEKEQKQARSPLVFQQTLDNLLDQYINQLNNAKYVNRYLQDQQLSNSQRVICRNSNNNYQMLKIMEDIYFCQDSYFINSTHKFKQEGITHVITSLTVIPKFFVSLVIPISSKQSKVLASQLCPKISDILRQVLLLKGKLLFVNDKTNYATNLLIFTLSYWFRCSVYETWCLINNQILLFPTFTSDLSHLSKTLHRLNLIEQHIETLPKLQCICSSVTMILKRKTVDKKGQYRICKCKSKGRDKQQSQCPSLGCTNYVQFLRKRYNIDWGHIKWSLLSENNFLTNPLQGGYSKNNLRSQLILNSGLPRQNIIQAGSCLKNWKVFKCKVCQMWMFSINQNNEIWVVMNNQIKSTRQGIMIPNAQQNFKMRTPALNYYTLSKLHMIEQ